MSNAPIRNIVALLVAGNGRGARAMLPYIEKHNRTSTSTELVLACAEPVPGKGDLFAAEANRRGVRAKAVEATGEQMLASERLGDAIIAYCAVDRAISARGIVGGARARNLAVVGYFLLSFPEPIRKLFGIQFVVRPDELQAHAELSLLLDTLTAVVPRGSSRDVFGGGEGSSQNLSEPIIRQKFAEHLTQNAPKVISGLEPETAPLEIVSPERTSTMRVMDHRRTWAEPNVLIAELLNLPDVTLRRGGSIVIAEVGPDSGLRLHQLTTRISDGRMTFGGLLGELNHSALVAREANARAEEATRQAQSVTISRLSPVDMTD